MIGVVSEQATPAGSEAMLADCPGHGPFAGLRRSEVSVKVFTSAALP